MRCPPNIAEMKSEAFGKRHARVARESGSTRVMVILGAAALLVILVAMLRGAATRTGAPGSGNSGSGVASEGAGSAGSGGSDDRPKPRLMSRSGGGGGPAGSAAVVANKVAEFSRGRRELVEKLAQRLNVNVSPEVDQFFSAVEAGDWRSIKALYHTVSAQAGAADAPAGLSSLLPAIKETYSVAEAKEAWPADDLLSYGQTVLAALKPGMVYVGGSRWGSSIPALMNETSGEGRAVLLDQSMLSDPSYVDYLGLMYSDRMTTLSKEDTERAQGGYLAALRERARNNQLRPGESVPEGDPRQAVVGSAGASEVAENLMLALLYKNPGMTVAIEKPAPGSPLYDLATPMGPIFEVRSPAGGGDAAGGATTAAQAEQAANYWREAATQLQALPETDATVGRRQSMADMAVAQANMLASRSLGGQAEQTYRSAIDIAPMSIDPVNELAKYLQGAGRANEAQQLFDEYLRRNPGKENEVSVVRSRLGGPKG